MIDVWTDGSGTFAHGPACIGVVVIDGGELVCEASEFVGLGTNNVAELRAIRRGLYLAAEIAGFGARVTVHSDSEYALGAIARPEFTPHANEALVCALRRQAAAFSRLSFEHVKGHSGVALNELADWLAGRARASYLARQGIARKLRRRPELAEGRAA